MGIVIWIFIFFQPSPQEQFIERFAPLAIEEMRIFGIPASVTLAQAILESNSGRSHPALYWDNFFGMHCHKKTHKLECAPYVDAGDSCRLYVYQTEWHSFRAHSAHITQGRYKTLPKLCGKNPWSWCNKLQEFGYSTDPDYSWKLGTIIKTFNLTKYDHE